jgi:hypothetical protein
MANDDIKDLIGRYATGALTAEEQKRLFHAALDDQDLFNEIAQEQDIKQLIAEPGARGRLIHALAPPPRKTAWIFGVAATAALTVVIALVLLRPKPAPSTVAIVKNPPVAAETAAPSAPPGEAATAPKSLAASQPAPAPLKRKNAPQPLADVQSGAVPQPVKQKTADEPARDASKDIDSAEKREKKAENKVEDRKETDRVAAAAPVAPPPPAAAPAAVTPSPAPPAAARASAQSSARVGEAIQSPLQQQRMSGPRQQAQQKTQSTNQQSVGGAAGGLSRISSTDAVQTPPFGFHYSTETKGHLILIPAADGYLTVKSSDGATLFARKRVAAGIVIDVALPDGANSVSVTFAASALPLPPAPVVRTDPEGTVEGATRLAVEIRINN